MPKLTFNAIDRVENLDFEKARIYTNNYNSKIKPSTTHVPTAAKIVLTSGDKITIFIAELPIILCNENCDIQIFTQTPFDLASLKTLENFKTEFNRKILREESSVLQAKSVFGLTSEEVVRLKITDAKLEFHKIIAKLNRSAEGGGF